MLYVRFHVYTLYSVVYIDIRGEGFKVAVKDTFIHYENCSICIVKDIQYYISQAYG